MMELLSDPNAWAALLTLTALEIVLGIDNLVFISILASKLPEDQQAKARNVGLLLAMATRIVLLFSISWLMSLTEPLFSVLGQGFTGRDLILLIGGLFLIGKATHEIHDKLEGDHQSDGPSLKASFGMILFQIIILDVVFSLDSVITAVGMADQLAVMVAAVVISILFMLFTAKAISEFVNKHPTVKILALSFLILIGVALFMEGFHQKIPKGYIYFAMAFSIIVELLNMRFRTKRKPVHLHDKYEEALSE